jgi:hypothetical protein
MADPKAKVHVGYLCELYSSTRHAAIPADERGELLLCMVLEALEHVSNGRVVVRRGARAARLHAEGP